MLPPPTTIQLVQPQVSAAITQSAANTAPPSLVAGAPANPTQAPVSQAWTPEESAEFVFPQGNPIAGFNSFAEGLKQAAVTTTAVQSAGPAPGSEPLNEPLPPRLDPSVRRCFIILDQYTNIAVYYYDQLMYRQEYWDPSKWTSKARLRKRKTYTVSSSKITPE